MKILVIRTSSLGDVVMTTPAIEFIKKNTPDCELIYIVEKAYAPLLKNHPYIDKLVELNWNGCGNNVFKLIKEIKRVLKILKKEKIDIAFDFQGLLRSVIFLWFSGAKKKFGRGKWPLLNGYKPHRKKLSKHNVYQNYEITALAGLNVDNNYKQNISHCIEEINFQDITEQHIQSFEKIIAINPWTRWKSKSIPAKLLADACNILGDKCRCHFFILGSEKEREHAEDVFYRIKHKKSMLTGKLNLNQLAGFLTKINVLITGDTGPMHMASALNTPQVAIFGPTNPIRTGPYEGNYKIILNNLGCMPCFKRKCPFSHQKCIKELSADEIANTAFSLIQ